MINVGIAAAGAGLHTGLVALQIIGAAAGILLLGGLWTPAAGVLAGAVEGWIAFTAAGNDFPAITLATLGASLAMIGPGAWSIDARLYGRKQILPPEP